MSVSQAKTKVNSYSFIKPEILNKNIQQAITHLGVYIQNIERLERLSYNKQTVDAGKPKGLYFVPINFKNKPKPTSIKNAKETTVFWRKQKTAFTAQDFKEGYNIALDTGRSAVICIDIDSKAKNGFTPEQKEAIGKLVRNIKNPKIPVDRSISGEGYHIYIRIEKEKEQKFMDKFKQFNCTQSYLAKHLEFKTNALALLPPSRFENYQSQYINSNILNVDFLEISELEQLIDIVLLPIADICGKYEGVTNIEKTAIRNNLKSQNTNLQAKLLKQNNQEANKQLIYNYIPDGIKEQLNTVNKLYFTIINKNAQEQFQRRFEKIQELLERLDIQTYKITQDKKIQIRSLLYDDGNTPDAYIYANEKQVMYYDFHDDFKANLLYILYFAFTDKLLEVLKELYPEQFIEPKPTIVIKDKKELLPTILDQLKLDRNILIQAPTGYGKTTTIKELSNTHKLLLFEPLATQVMQESKSYDPDIDKVCFCEGSSTDNTDFNHRLIIATTAQARNYKDCYISEAKERITVIDEAHTLISDIGYRRKDTQAINEILKVAKHTIYTTATTRFTGLQNLVDVVIKVEPKEKSNRFIQKALIDAHITKKEAIIQEILQDANKHPKAILICLIDSKKTLNFIKEKVEPKTARNIRVITSENTRYTPELTEDITKDGIIENNDIILTTRKLSLGINIYNAGTIIFYTIDNDVNIIEQSINRVRRYDKNGKEINNTVICKLFAKKPHIYYNYEKEFAPLLNDLKEIQNKLQVDDSYKGKNTLKMVAKGSILELHYLAYQRLIAISRHNDTYIISELVNAGWKKLQDKKITYADKVKTLGKVKKIEVFKQYFNQIYETVKTQFKILLTGADESVFEQFKEYTKKQRINSDKKECLKIILKALELEHSFNELIPVVEKANTMRSINNQIEIWNSIETEEKTNLPKMVLDYVKSNSFNLNNKQIITVKEIYDKFKSETLKIASFINYVLEKAGYQNKVVRIDKQTAKCFVKQT